MSAGDSGDHVEFAALARAGDESGETDRRRGHMRRVQINLGPPRGDGLQALSPGRLVATDHQQAHRGGVGRSGRGDRRLMQVLADECRAGGGQRPGGDRRTRAQKQAPA